MSRLIPALAMSLLLAARTVAAPFDVPIDPNPSTLYFELCIAGSCDTDSSSVTGTVTIDLDSIENPAWILLYDFDMQLTDDLYWNISWGILGNLDATATGVVMRYATPGTPMGPNSITGGQFAFIDVPTDMQGLLTYNATGLPCASLLSAGWPCNDTRNLADEGTQLADEFAGTVSVQNRIVSLTSSIDVTTPLDPNNPGLGTFRVYGTVYGQTYVPLPGDFDDDGDVDLIDHATFFECMNGPEATNPPAPCDPADFDAADLDADNDVDLADYAAFSENFTG
ncbi:MAG: hypothetical protein IID40_09520 [Planctomycetes bacterium]|nr:hypothetical protein [Planctomycetota bacterium]